MADAAVELVPPPAQFDHHFILVNLTRPAHYSQQSQPPVLPPPDLDEAARRLRRLAVDTLHDSQQDAIASHFNANTPALAANPGNNGALQAVLQAALEAGEKHNPTALELRRDTKRRLNIAKRRLKVAESRLHRAREQWPQRDHSVLQDAVASCAAQRNVCDSRPQSHAGAAA